MTNRDKYLKENASVEELIQNLTNYINKTQKPTYEKIKNFFEQKAKLLTEDERVILRNIDKRWKNIYRNSGGGLELHEIYLGEEQMMIFYSYNHLFQFIKERRRILY